MNIKLEICANSVHSALEAQRGDAYRVELCENVETGGVTPSHGAIITARKLLNIKLNVLIRPRAGDFCYDDTELEIMKSDIEFCRSAGVDGVVFGVLKENGTVDVNACKMLMEVASPLLRRGAGGEAVTKGLDTTFHRAFDVTPNAFEAMEEIISLGFKRILTSGQKVRAIEGIDLIKELIDRTSGRISIMPGAGVNEENIIELIRFTHAGEFHASLREPKSSRTEFRNEDVSFGDDDFIMVTSSERVRNMVEIISKIVN